MGLAAYRGYRKGIIVELFSFLAFFIGLIAAFQLTPFVTDSLLGNSEWKGTAYFVVFLFLFLILAMTVNAIAKIIKKTASLLLLGWLDGALGAFLALFKMALLISAILWVILIAGIEIPMSDLKDSKIYNLIVGFAPWVYEKLRGLFPIFEEMKNNSQKFI